MSGQVSMFDVMFPNFKIDKLIKLIKLFGDIGSQSMSLRNIGANFEHYKLAEWEVSAMLSYKAIHMPNDDTDYSEDISKGELPEILYNFGISNNGKTPMTLNEIKRKGEKWQRIVYNTIKATHNLCSVCNFHGNDMQIVNTDDFTYLLTYSFPCQDLSVAGKMKGMSKGSETRSGLLWEVERLLSESEHLPQVLLMENVPQVISNANIKDFRQWQKFLEDKGYSNYTEVLNAKNYGVAQNRERCFMVSLLGEWNYKFPQPIPLTKTMKDYLEDEVDEKYYINSEKAQKLIQQLIDSGQLKNNQECIDLYNQSVRKDGCTGTLTANTGTQFHCGSMGITEKVCVDGSINEPKIKDVMNCITARYDCGISNQRSVGGVVIERS